MSKILTVALMALVALTIVANGRGSGRAQKQVSVDRRVNTLILGVGY